MSPPRPATVTVAFALQLALVGLILLSVGVAVADAIHYDGLIDRAALATHPDPGEVASERSFNVAFAAIYGGIALVMAGWLGITAIGVRRGSNVARILALVALGLPLVLAVAGCALFAVFALAFVGMLASVEPGFDEEAGFADEVVTGDFYGKLDELSMDGWSTAYSIVDSIAFVLGSMVAVAVAVLLLVSVSHRFFRPLPVPPPRLVPVHYYWSGYPRP